MSAGPNFRLVVSGLVMQQLRALREEAALAGLEAEYADLLRSIAGQLETRPVEWGDPLWTLRQIGVVIYHRMSGDFSVTDGVDAERQLVYLRGIRLLSDNG
jgi:hypothetical protein